MVRLADFIDESEADEAPLPDNSTPAADTPELEAEEVATAEAEEQEAAGEAETGAKEEGAAAGEDDLAPLREIVEAYGDTETLKDALGFHQKFIAGDEEETDQALVDFAQEMQAVSPARYGRFVEMIVQKFAPKYGFEKAETEGDEFEDDDYETDREKALAERVALLEAKLADSDATGQQSEEKALEESFLADVGGSITEMLTELNLHPDIATDALNEICREVAASPEFNRARKAVVNNDGKRAKSLVIAVQEKAGEILGRNTEKYARRSNALKTYEANTKPKAPVGKPGPEVVAAAHVQTEISEKRPLPPRGAPLTAYA